MLGRHYMTHIAISGMPFHQYQINLDINSGEIIGIYMPDYSLRKELLDIIAGINPSRKTCLYQGNDCFNNTAYFKNRVYLDFSRKYLSTLRPAVISERLQYKYGRDFAIETFAKIARDLDLRGETEITYEYKFTPAGNTYVNYALIAAVGVRNIIVNHPLIAVTDPADRRYLVFGLTDKNRFDSAILGLDLIGPFSGRIDKIMLLSDKMHLINPQENLMVFPREHPKITNRLHSGRRIISRDQYSKEDLRAFAKDKCEPKKITVYELDDYWGDAI